MEKYLNESPIKEPCTPFWLKMSKFPTKQEWEESPKLKDEILKWKDVPQEIIYCIDYIKYIQTEHNWDTYILHYSDEQGAQYKAFCPGDMLKQIRQKRKPTHQVYFVAYGVNKINGKNIPNFDIHLQIITDEFDIFEKQE